MPKPDRSDQTLSVCMIVKNEAQFLADCLASIAGLADQIVVVDTGSTDDTLKIAARYKAEIYHFDWVGDFSAARNESIRHASGDWIFWLDADERLKPDSQSALRALLRPEKKAVAYIINIMNRLADGQNYKLSKAHRLFNNHRGIIFEGRIHEQIAGSVGRQGGEERTSAVFLEHLGYGLAPREQALKHQRNLQLLETMAAENPGDAYAHFTLAQQYQLLGRSEEAHTHFLRAVGNNRFTAGMKASLYNTTAEVSLALGRIDEALDFCKRSIAITPKQVGAWFIKYKAGLAHENYREAMAVLEKIKKYNAELKTKPGLLSGDVLLSDDQLRLTESILLRKTGRPDEALNLLERIDTAFSGRQRVLQEISEICLELNRLESAEQALRTLLLLAPQDAVAVQRLGLLLTRRQAFAEAIVVYQNYLRIQPGQPQIVRLCAGLLAKTGQTEQAVQLLQTARPVLS